MQVKKEIRVKPYGIEGFVIGFKRERAFYNHLGEAEPMMFYDTTVSIEDAIDRQSPRVKEWGDKAYKNFLLWYEIHINNLEEYANEQTVVSETDFIAY